MDIKEIKEKIAHWQEVEDNGGSPTSARKIETNVEKSRVRSIKSNF